LNVHQGVCGYQFGGRLRELIQSIGGSCREAFPSLSPMTKVKEKMKIPQEILGKRGLSKSLSSG